MARFPLKRPVMRSFLTVEKQFPYGVTVVELKLNRIGQAIVVGCRFVKLKYAP